MNIVIVEDEILAAERLRNLVLAYDPGNQVLALLDSVEDTVEWLSSHSAPDLLLLDIQLADGLSFSILERVPVRCPVIFTTAYDHYALQAFELYSVAYLLKPITPIALAKALNKLHDLRQMLHQPLSGTISPEVLSSLQHLIQEKNSGYKSKFLVKAGARLQTVPVEKIAYFYSADSYTYLQTTYSSQYILNYTLDELEELIAPSKFFRVSRKFLVSFPAVQDIHSYFKGRLQLQLQPDPGSMPIVSTERVAAFKEWLEH